MSDHLVEIDQEWSLWNEMVVRGAGFPVAEVLHLATPEVAAAADAWLRCEDALAVARDAAIEALDGALAGLRGKDRDPVVRAIKAIRRGEVPAGEEAAIGRLRDAATAHTAARADLDRVFETAHAGLSSRLADAARAPKLREAIVWQNRAAIHSALDRLGAGTSSKARQHEQLVARYLQRYCTKNETIGFFGPVGWGTLGDATTEVAPGRGLVASRAVYFEHWCIDTLATALAAAPEVRPELAPRLLPTVAITGTQLTAGTAHAVVVPVVIARLLGACDGSRSAREIATALVGDPELELSDELEVYELLHELCERKLVTWTLEIPSSVTDPARHLRGLIERFADDTARTLAIVALDRLVTARDRVAAATAPEEIDRAIGELEVAFTELTSASATRRAGEMYAGRTLVYLDCRRDLEVRLGRTAVDRLARVLVPVLHGARWYTFEIARRYRALAGALHRELGGGRIAWLRFWEQLAPHFNDRANDRAAIVDEVAELLDARWRDLLPISTGARRVELDAGKLRDARRVFAAPSPGWPTATHLSPDVMIAARDVAAIARGDFTFVLGELHIGNTASSFLAQHPDPERFIAWMDRDRGTIGVSPVEAKAVATRVDRVSRSPDDFDVELGPSRSWRPRDHVLRAADLVVEPRGTTLDVVHTSGRRFDIISFLDQYLTFASSAHFKLVGRADHGPRVTIDGVVVAREHWTLAADDLGFAHDARPETRYAGARRWARRHGFPRWVFAKTADERKPIFVDFDSPILVELLAKMLRPAAAVTITEMVPDLEHAWLPDADGHTYTSELRMIAVDAWRWTAAS